MSFNERENYIALTQSTVGICLRDRLSIELTFHFFSRRICAKIPSYVNLSICFTVLLQERENYIALNYPILYAVVLSFSSSGANFVLKLGGNCPDIGGELSGTNCPRGGLSGYHTTPTVRGICTFAVFFSVSTPFCSFTLV